jgi:exonuclease III
MAYCNVCNMRGLAAHSVHTLSIYQNVKGLRTEQLDNVSASDFDIICLTETWLNDSYYTHNLFPNGYTVYRSDRTSIHKACGGGVLIAFPASLGSCCRRFDPELCPECVWVEFPTVDGPNLLVGNYYFPPDAKPQLITNYFLPS